MFNSDPASDWHELGRTGAQMVNAFEARRQARQEARAEEAARFQLGAPGWEGWDEAAQQNAIRDALLAELKRYAPNSPLLRDDIRSAIAQRGLNEFVRKGREAMDDSSVVSSGLVNIPR